MGRVTPILPYCGTPHGFIYLVVIIDWYSRFIVGWAMSNTMQSDFVVRTVKEAVQAHGAPTIINSDQGSQFTSKDYIACIKSHDTIKISMDGIGRAKDNATGNQVLLNQLLTSGKGICENINIHRIATTMEIRYGI
jgi:transposase InsO family protein